MIGPSRACACPNSLPLQMLPVSPGVTVSVLNLTETPISISIGGTECSPVSLLHGQTSAAFGHLPIPLTLTSYNKGTDSVYSTALKLRQWASTKRKWEPLECQGAPWRVYRLEASEGHHKIVLFKERSLESWMSELPDSLALSNLCLPGIVRQCCMRY